MFKQTIAAKHTTLDKDPLAKENMLPRGSALVTSSGDLSKQGIDAIIHAATGAMTKSGGIYEPTQDSIKHSVLNSFELLNANNFNKLAVTFIGGSIFAGRIGITNEALAKIIVDACFASNPEASQFVIVIYKSVDVATFTKVITENYPKADLKSVLKQGSVLDFSLHQCDTIMNAANMEVRFGGNLSGKIATATGERTHIDAEALADIKAFWASKS
ncbi:hypothetical protein [Psychroserpens sp. SPM9]|uniref:hypothetical protein n=1 Tax=Psychroserpens sp. SPM9 TaxID=2975598 RepID=UPI0021A2C5C0|nr:hypothetical protein [Psychroserpens sp. SPM9]MDG5492707.1 hypothetical protein [Psychroserpens sp. SPM9]